MRAVVVGFLVVSACSWMGPNRAPNDEDVALRVASELESAHRYAIARSQLAAIADIVGPVEAEEIRLRACRTYGLAGRDDEERQCYASLTAIAPGKTDDDEARARELEARAARKLVTTSAENEAFIAAYAETDAARRALVAQLADSPCPDKLGLLSRLENVGDAWLRADIAVRRAELLFGECRDDAHSLDAARHAVDVAAKTQWRDDAAWIHGRAAERAGRADEALAAYHSIIETRSDAIPFGSNDSLFLDDAWLAHGLLLEKLGRYDEARKSFRGLIDARQESRLRDDAERAIARMPK